VSSGFVEVSVYVLAFDHVAGTAARYQIARVLLALAGSRHNEIHGHSQGVLKGGATVQAAIAASIVVAFEDLDAFLQSYRGGYEVQGGEVQGHEYLQSGRVREPGGYREFQYCGRKIGQRMVSVKGEREEKRLAPPGDERGNENLDTALCVWYILK